MTDAERREALDAIAREVAVCTGCRLHEGRTRAVPGEGSADTEVVFVGEGPGFNEDRQGRPFVGRAGDLLVRLLGTLGWRREDVFITNVVKCRPPDNRDPEPDEIVACAPFLRRQLAILDPALVVTLGRHSMGRFMPGARIGQVHGTYRPADPALGAADALVYAMYHPAAALRSAEVERQSYEDAAGIPAALLAARERRAGRDADAPGAPAAIEMARAADPAGAAPQPAESESRRPEPAVGSLPPSEPVAPAPHVVNPPLAASPAVSADPPPVPAVSPSVSPAGPADPSAQLTLFGGSSQTP